MSASSAGVASPGWTRVAERGSLWGLRFVVWWYRLLGRRFCLALAHGIVAYFFLTDPRGRGASLAYLRRVWANREGREALARKPGAWLSFLHYRAFAVAIVDRLEIWFGTAGSFAFETHGMEYIDRLTEEGRGAIILGAHLGSFDAMRLLAKRTHRTVNVLMFTAHATRINTIFKELSPEAEARVIQADPSSIRCVFEIRECLDRGEFVAILGDRVEPSDRGRSSSVSFLGGSVRLPQAPFLLANLLRCPVVLMLAMRCGGGRYEVFAERLAERLELSRAERDKAIDELLAAYAARLEHYCLRFPLQWFNFFDYWGKEEVS